MTSSAPLHDQAAPGTRISAGNTEEARPWKTNRCPIFGAEIEFRGVSRRTASVLPGPRKERAVFRSRTRPLRGGIGLCPRSECVTTLLATTQSMCALQAGPGLTGRNLS